MENVLLLFEWLSLGGWERAVGGVAGAEAEGSTVRVLLYHEAAKESEDQKRKMCRGD